MSLILYKVQRVKKKAFVSTHSHLHFWNIHFLSAPFSKAKRSKFSQSQDKFCSDWKIPSIKQFPFFIKCYISPCSFRQDKRTGRLLSLGPLGSCHAVAQTMRSQLFPQKPRVWHHIKMIWLFMACYIFAQFLLLLNLWDMFKWLHLPLNEGSVFLCTNY